MKTPQELQSEHAAFDAWAVINLTDTDGHIANYVRCESAWLASAQKRSGLAPTPSDWMPPPTARNADPAQQNKEVFEQIRAAFEKIVNVAYAVDSWESFPREPIERAEAALKQLDVVIASKG